MVVKKTKKRVFAWKPIVAVSGAVIAIFVVIFFVLYFANKPNYRDLEKEFERISTNIPVDWQLVSESSNKGTFGLICLSIGSDSPCPILAIDYSKTGSSNPTEDKAVVERLLKDDGYSISSTRYNSCTVGLNYNEKYFCYAEGVKGKFSAWFSISKDYSSNILKLSATLEPKSATGIQ